MTIAKEFIINHQKKYPPLYPRFKELDRAQQLYQNLVPILPRCILDLFTSEYVALGEIGDNVPDIQTLKLPSGNFVIEFNSGMMDFDYAVARGLAGLFVRNTSSGTANSKPLELSEVTCQIAKIFMQWQWYKRWLWKLRRIKYSTFIISESAHGWVETMSNIAELFMLAHEIGHIALDIGILPHRTGNEEEDADSFALKLLTAKKDTDPALLFSGVIFAIRIFVGLEKVGVRFSNAYPPQTERIANVSSFMRLLCPSRQYYHEISRIAVSVQDMMDDVEAHIVKSTCSINQDAEKLTVRLIAELLEVAMKRAPKKIVTMDIIKIIKQTPANITQQIIDTIKKYYISDTKDESYFDPETKREMGTLIREVLSELPEPSLFSLLFWQSQ